MRLVLNLNLIVQILYADYTSPRREKTDFVLVEIVVVYSFEFYQLHLNKHPFHLIRLYLLISHRVVPTLSFPILRLLVPLNRQLRKPTMYTGSLW